jgi:iron(III) transport system permease protein
VWLEGWQAAVWIHTAAAIPWVVLIVGAGLWLVEPELEEQALLDASPGRVFLHVTLPAAMPAVALAALWIAVQAAGEMTVTDMFSVRTYSEELYTSLRVTPDPEGGQLPAVPGLILAAWLVGLGIALAWRWSAQARPLSLRTRRVFALGRWQLPLALAAGLLVVVLVGIPLLNLGYQAGLLVAQTATGRVRTWSAAKCLGMIAAAPWGFRREVGWSFGVAALSATAAVFVGALLGWFARRGRVRGAVLLAVVTLGLAVPGPLVGLWLIRLLNRPPLDYLYTYSILAPWLALTLRTFAPATLILWTALRTIPPELLDSAALDGAGPWQRFWHLGLRSRPAALGVAWLVALALGVGDLAATVLVVPPGMETLSVRIFDLIHSGVQDRVAGICLALALAMVAAGGIVFWLANLARRRGVSPHP